MCVHECISLLSPFASETCSVRTLNTPPNSHSRMSAVKSHLHKTRGPLSPSRPRSQAFDDAIRGGPDEKGLWERNKAHTSGFFLDMSLQEASPTIRLDLESRCACVCLHRDARAAGVVAFCSIDRLWPRGNHLPILRTRYFTTRALCFACQGKKNRLPQRYF